MAFINQYLLADSGIYLLLRQQLHLLLRGQIIKIDEPALKSCVYACWQARHYTWPDQVFLGHWNNVSRRKRSAGGWCVSVLGQAARYHFEPDDRRLSLKPAKFDEWQAWIANQSGLPVMAYQLAQHIQSSTLNAPFALLQLLRQQVGSTTLAAPYHALVEDYIQHHGLHETHLHLNGTTLAESTWLHALLHPQQVTEVLSEKHANSHRVQLLYAANPILGEPSQLHALLQLARLLRELILAWLAGQSKDEKSAKKAIYSSLGGGKNSDAVSNFWHEKQLFSAMATQEHIAELHWQVRLITRLEHEESPIIDTVFWLYLQCMNNFQKFSVQRSDQYGFDCFQKFSDNGIRDEAEQYYLARFKQLHGSVGDTTADIATLECRFAPKVNMLKNSALLEKILTGFLHYSEGEPSINHADDLNAVDLNTLAKRAAGIDKPALRLVAHFIKRPWSASEGQPHFKLLRESLIEQAEALMTLRENMPALKKVVTGIDAAGNELDAPPDVFSALYRYCRYRGMRNFTYHAGEDFEHLLTGIRVVYDAVNCLKLCNGDRLGHATAIGIHPSIWLQAMPEKTYIQRGQRLDDLLFLRQIAFENPQALLRLDCIERSIRILMRALFLPREHSNITLDVLQDAFLYRRLSPDVVKSYLEGSCMTYTGWLHNEVNDVKKVEKNLGRDVLKCLALRWFDVGVMQRSEEYIEIDLATDSEATLIAAQQYVQHKVASAKVVIETLPTSNVRIGHYQSIKQHHLFRWLHLPGSAVKGDAHLLVALGSDDPGIFATSLKNEFYHVFFALMNDLGCSAEEALSYVARINENGRIYRFDDGET